MLTVLCWTICIEFWGLTFCERLDFTVHREIFSWVFFLTVFPIFSLTAFSVCRKVGNLAVNGVLEGLLFWIKSEFKTLQMNFIKLLKFGPAKITLCSVFDIIFDSLCVQVVLWFIRGNLWPWKQDCIVYHWKCAGFRKWFSFINSLSSNQPQFAKWHGLPYSILLFCKQYVWTCTLMNECNTLSLTAWER